MITLNATNELLLNEMSDIQKCIDDNQVCRTLTQEALYLYKRGASLIWLPEMTVQLTGRLIDKLDDIVPEQLIKVYPIGNNGKVARSYEQSLNASVKMVAVHSALMAGHTDVKTVTTALTTWALEDNVSLNFFINWESVAEKLVLEMINVGILNDFEGTAITDTGAFYNAFGCTAELNELRVKTLRNLWKRAQPRMQPMKHAVTWRADGRGNAVCEIPNLKLVKGKSKVKQTFIDSANKAGAVEYVVNNAIRAELELWLERAELPDMPDDFSLAEQIIVKHEQKVKTVEELIQLPLDRSMFFPHTADWRGRLYSRGGLTHFQSIKECKAIFDFKEYVTIKDTEGLFLHIANAHAQDKLSIDKRLEWVNDNFDNISKGLLAQNIYAKRASLALKEYRETGQTNVIVHLDGTCNGTQWTSAMYRDAITAKLVNCLRSTSADKPEDLYGFISDVCIKLAQGNRKIVFKNLRRELTKSPIMTLGYGASETALIENMKDYLKGENYADDAKLVVKTILTAVKMTAPAVLKLTDNLKRIMKLHPRNKISWSAFDLTVEKEYNNTEHLNLHGTKYTAKLRTDKSKPKSDEQLKLECDELRRGLSPNLIHSYDSAHMRAIIFTSKVPISGIHDSVGCPANAVKETSEIIRKAFYHINQVDLVENIYKALGAQYTQQRGKLDLEDVLHATYLFS